MSGSPTSAHTIAETLRTELGAEIVSGFPHEVTGDGLPRVAPRELEDWRKLLELAGIHGWTIATAGHGQHPIPPGVDLVASTLAWSGVTAYEPGDGTLTARTGTPMAELEATVTAGGHHLSPAVPHPERRSLGGVLGAGDSGHERLRFGPVRHQLLGMRVLLADGSEAKSGGALVKNVTGYDLHRLYCGSRGSLCVILEASLRLYPAPDRRSVLRSEHDSLAAAWEAARAVLARPVRPWSVFVEGQAPGPWTTTVCLAGRDEVLAWELETLASVLPSAERREVEAFERPDKRCSGRWLGRPSRLGAFLQEAEAEGVLGDGRWCLEPGVASARFAGDASTLGGLDAKAEVHGVQSAGRAASSQEAEWFERLKLALDPDRRFPDAGGFHG